MALAWAWSAVLVGVPAAVGTLLGGLHATRTSRAGWRLVRRWLPPPWEARLLAVAFGPRPAPRAWDHLFSTEPRCLMRVTTVEGENLYGYFTDDASAAVFPQEPDLLLEGVWPVDANNDPLAGSGPYRLYVAPGRISSVVVYSDHRKEHA